jgi:hypothetical protein
MSTRPSLSFNNAGRAPVVRNYAEFLVHGWQDRDISYGGVSVKAASVSVLVEANGQMADVTVFIPGYTQAAHKTYAAIAFLFLDEALGEYDVETRVGQVNVNSASKAPPHSYSLEALPKAVDALLAHK